MFGLRSVDEAVAADVLWCDGIAVGSPTNMGLLSWKMKRFWDDTMREHWMAVDGKIGCAFSSSGGWGGGTEMACQSILTVLINFGLLVFGVTDYVGKLTTLHYGAITAREPRSEETQAACRMLGQRLAEWTAALFTAARISTRSTSPSRAYRRADVANSPTPPLACGLAHRL